MKDLIAKLQLDANCALGAIWMHIDAQAARIAELEEQQAFGIGETYANALSRIAELEAQIAAKDAPAVYQHEVAEITECDAYPDHSGRIEAFAFLPIGTKLYAAPLPANIKKLREAILAMRCVNPYKEDHCNLYKEGYAVARQEAAELAASTALQAPVREVPEGPRKVVEQMHHALSVAEGYMDAVCFNTTNPKKRNNYAGGLRIIRDAMSAYEALPLPADPVQEPKP